MSGHWSDSEDTLRRYKDIDYTLEVQRPIAFLIATNRKFNLGAFCDTSRFSPWKSITRAIR